MDKNILLTELIKDQKIDGTPLLNIARTLNTSFFKVNKIILLWEGEYPVIISPNEYSDTALYLTGNGTYNFFNISEDPLLADYMDPEEAMIDDISIYVEQTNRTLPQIIYTFNYNSKGTGISLNMHAPEGFGINASEVIIIINMIGIYEELGE